MGCLDSLRSQTTQINSIVYIDSGSTDGSCEAVRAQGIAVVELDASQPFTAARARNTGLAWIHQISPDCKYVQFIDGDCELEPSWLQQARTFMETHPGVAVVCGQRREHYPEATPYNRLADMEWNTPVGEATACGGDALMRIKAVEAVEGYNPALICGEEPELCIRLRRHGWKIYRLDADMTRHDAAMDTWTQWWQRSVRGGWAIAEGYAMYGQAPEQYMAREYFSGWVWGLGLPLVAVGLIPATAGWSLCLLAAYPLLASRIYRYRHRQRGDSAGDAALYAGFCTLSKLPQVVGQIRYWLTRWRGQRATLIEYKPPIETGARS